MGNAGSKLFPLLTQRPSLVVKGEWHNTKKIVVFRISTVTLNLRNAPKHFCFLDLPAEMRNMAYAEVLVICQVYFDERRKRKSYQKPEVGLLRVCKQIHAEAEPLYLSNNLFHLPVNFADLQPFRSYLTWDHLFSTAGLTLIRNITIEFEISQLQPLDFKEQWDCYEEENGAGSFCNMTPEERRDQADVRHTSEAARTYDAHQCLLSKFTSEMNYIHADFGKAFCTGDCCRPINHCIDCWIVKLAPKILDITSLRAGEEDGPLFIDLRDPTHTCYDLENLKQMLDLRILEAHEQTRWKA